MADAEFAAVREELGGDPREGPGGQFGLFDDRGCGAAGRGQPDAVADAGAAAVGDEVVRVRGRRDRDLDQGAAEGRDPVLVVVVVVHRRSFADLLAPT